MRTLSSGGTRQKVSAAIASCSTLQYWYFDEPTEQQALIRWLPKFKKQNTYRKTKANSFWSLHIYWAIWMNWPPTSCTCRKEKMQFFKDMEAFSRKKSRLHQALCPDHERRTPPMSGLTGWQPKTMKNLLINCRDATVKICTATISWRVRLYSSVYFILLVVSNSMFQMEENSSAPCSAIEYYSDCITAGESCVQHHTLLQLVWVYWTHGFTTYGPYPHTAEWICRCEHFILAPSDRRRNSGYAFASDATGYALLFLQVFVFYAGIHFNRIFYLVLARDKARGMVCPPALVLFALIYAMV